mgnify:CR=1 FL=1
MSPTRKKQFIFLSPLVVFIIMVIVLSSGLGKDPTELDSKMIGKPLPEFELQSLTNANKVLTQIDIDGPALLNVFASWCPSCYVEHPYFMKMQANNEIPIYGINYKDERRDGMKFVTDLGNPYKEIIFDYDGRLGIELGVYGAPETFVIDNNNQIIYRHVGVVDARVWNDVIKPKLASGAGQ